LRDFFGGARKAHEISTDEITHYQAYWLEQTWHGNRLKPATVNYECCMLRHGLALAERADKLAKRLHFPMLRVRNARTGFFEREQLDAVLRHLPSYFPPVALAAYLTGWRTHSELLTRQWRHVDLINGWLRLEPGEGKPDRVERSHSRSIPNCGS
jgi:integrase